jgi:hypothetical protein
MIASALRVQRIVRVAGRRLYSDSTSPPTWGGKVGTTPRLIRNVASRNRFEAPRTGTFPPPDPDLIDSSSIKVANTNGKRLNIRFLNPNLRDGDELHTNNTFIQLPFIFQDTTVYGPATS